MAVKVAVTAFDAFIVRVQVEELPLHASPQVNAYPAVGVAVKVTEEFNVYEDEQAKPFESQSVIDPELAETVPLPTTVTTRDGELVKVALTVRFWFMVKVHVKLVPVQLPSPPQPPK